MSTFFQLENRHPPRRGKCYRLDSLMRWSRRSRLFDALLSEILMASTYPLEVIEADRWADANKNLKGDGNTIIENHFVGKRTTRMPKRCAAHSTQTTESPFSPTEWRDCFTFSRLCRWNVGATGLTGKRRFRG